MAGGGREEPSGSGGTPVRDAWSRWADRAWAAARRVHLGTRKPGNWVQLFKFGVVGGSGYAINLVAFALLNGSADLGHISAAIGAFLVAVTNNFAWNRVWTFRAEAPGRAPGASGDALPHRLARRPADQPRRARAADLERGRLAELPSQAIAVAVAMPANFIGNKLWTFS